VSFGRRILRSFSLLTLHLAGMVMLAAGAASVALGFSLEALAGASSEAGVNLVRVFASKLGITFLLTGSAAFVLLMIPGWFGFDRKGSSDTEAEEEIGGWQIFLALSLVALPLVALAVASPLIALWGELANRVVDDFGGWQELAEALGSQFGGLVLGPLFGGALPALFELAPLFASIASSAGLLILFSLRAREFPSAFLAWVLIQAACVLGSFYTIDLLANFTPALLNELRGDGAQEALAFAAWIRRHDEMVGPTVIRFAWIFLGYLVWAPALLVSHRAKRTFTVEAHSGRSRTVTVPSLNSVSARLAAARYLRAARPVAYDAGAQAERPQPKTPSSDAAQLADGLRYSTFLVRPILSLKSVLTNPEYKILAPVNGPGQEVVFYCRTKPGVFNQVFNLGFPLRVVTAAGEREVVLITKRRISLTSLAYTVRVPPAQETLGVFVRTDFGGTLWLLIGGDGRQIGGVARVAISPERYQAHIDEVPVCDFIWRYKLLGGDHVEISFAEEGDRTLDKRLGLAFGVLLERHVRSRNYN
jgi:hypothetical protein